MAQEKVLEKNLKKQLALAVRSIQWSYAIFWSISATQPGVLEWGDGYYNGDIKTRKTIQSIELNADQLGLQRSEQLRELYESLSAGEGSPQARRPSVALSPEDLTDTEWYYLVCMSFVFNIGQGLPGRTLATGQPIWLCNAYYADSKIFSRSLLAKSASIQTVVCFPFLRGVVELGVTEMVLEDPSLIQHVKTSFLDIKCPTVATNTSTRSDKELAGAAFDQEVLEVKSIPVVACEELDAVSPNDSSNNQPEEDSFMVEGINGGASQVQSWQLMDDDCVHYSLNSSDCISQTIVDPVKVAPLTNNEKANLQDVQDCNHTKLTALDLRSDDFHYQSVLSSLLKTSHPLILGSHCQNGNKVSSFVSWKKVGLVHYQISKGAPAQKLLKKILFEVPRMHVSGLPESPEDNSNRIGVWRPEADDIGANNVLLERKRREKLNERFMILKSIVPSSNKADKLSILDETIEYLQQMERRVEELESCRDSTELEARTRRKRQDAIERTSDNYGSYKIRNNKKPLVNKRKACNIDETEPGMDYDISKDTSTDNIIVCMNDKDVLIEIKCPWREGLLLEIIDAATQLHLDSHSVQSSTIDGILSLTIKSKKGLTAWSARAIKQVLERVASKC
ncbi:transcription factor GLABRA 3 isoform X2 [Hevea brasiliensis]|uniref:transcription factor GLABRA 3 isoform X2 n=1 Tax=Hevea brasiliensis TaxID=3981 RepID=UPI000B78159C|nr:transcription factor GLABRA 3 isoform X2 [Hevea brasiliensis]